MSISDLSPEQLRQLRRELDNKLASSAGFDKLPLTKVSAMILIPADADLNTAATAETLPVEDPNWYP
jgi:hypothetical protein